MSWRRWPACVNQWRATDRIVDETAAKRPEDFLPAGLYAAAGVAAAQSYPSKPIRMVTVEAGGSHGLQNDSDKPLLVMVIEYKITREEKLETEKVPLHLRGAASEMIAEIEKTRST